MVPHRSNHRLDNVIWSVSRFEQITKVRYIIAHQSYHIYSLAGNLSTGPRRTNGPDSRWRLTKFLDRALSLALLGAVPGFVHGLSCPGYFRNIAGKILLCPLPKTDVPMLLPGNLVPNQSKAPHCLVWNTRFVGFQAHNVAGFQSVITTSFGLVSPLAWSFSCIEATLPSVAGKFR